MERIEFFRVANDIEIEIILKLKLATGTFDDVIDVKTAENTDS